MKYKTRNQLDTLKIQDTTLTELTLNLQRLSLTIEGAIIKASNPNNTRFEDMYCPLLELTLTDIQVINFVQQGYKYYNADGILQSETPDRILSEDERTQVLAQAQGAYLFYFGANPDVDAGNYLLIFDIEKDEEITTYQLELTFKESLAQWNRYAGPVNE